MTTRGLVIAGTASGVGKTTVTAGVVAALRRRGLRVQPFKAGPDYIDPSYHTAAAGRPCRNLDSWMLAPPVLQEVFARACADADVAVVEGVMGLFDGRRGQDEEGSTAQVAKLLGLPVVLVLDAGGMARSTAATVLGYCRFDPALHVAGVVLNNVGSPGHCQLCREAIEAATGIPVLGYLPRRSSLTLPERHLGLIPTVEGPAGRAFFDELASCVAAHIDLDGLLRLSVPVRESGAPVVFPERALLPRTRIAVAMDRAFSFYYEDSLDLLRAWGAEVVPFSPLSDTRLPDGIGGVYIGGGFPELYAAELAENRAMHEALRGAAARGLPIYAECGGLMYLGTAIEDFDGRVHTMVGLVPARSRLHGSRLTLGYRTVRARRPTPLLAEGQSVRGHEFHWSALERPPTAAEAVYDVAETDSVEGFAAGSVVATYVHLHLAAAPGMAARWVETCARARRG